MGSTRPIQWVVDEGGREWGKPAVYSRDNATSTYGSATSIVYLRYSLHRIFVFAVYVYSKWNMHRKIRQKFSSFV
jgi:hypothetical protein